jgi:hypothetical protein
MEHLSRMCHSGLLAFLRDAGKGIDARFHGSKTLKSIDIVIVEGDLNVVRSALLQQALYTQSGFSELVRNPC